jgi:hypothetical protein
LAAIAILYLIYRTLGIYPELTAYIAALIGIFAIAIVGGGIWFGNDSLRQDRGISAPSYRPPISIFAFRAKGDVLQMLAHFRE